MLRLNKTMTGTLFQIFSSIYRQINAKFPIIQPIIDSLINIWHLVSPSASLSGSLHDLLKDVKRSENVGGHDGSEI